jgi:hypothetical protein
MLLVALASMGVMCWERRSRRIDCSSASAALVS